MATALEILLARLANERNAPLPAPAAPMNLGPLSNDTSLAFGAQNPEPVPPAFTPPAAPDMNFVNQYAGQAPVAPVERAPNFVDKLAAVLGGIAGGPQYAEQIRQQREAPIRRYEAEARGFEEKRTRGLELAERRAEREADRANRANEQLYENEYKKWLAKNGDRSDEAKLRMQQAFTLERDARAARLEAEREQQRERRQREAEAKQIASRFFTLSKNQGLSAELGRHYAGLSDKPLSAAAAKLDAQVQGVGEARMGRALTGGRGGGSGISAQTAKLVEEFNNARQNLISATARGDAKGQKDLRLRLSQLVKRLAGRPGVEAGYGAGQWPYVKVNGQMSTGEAGQQKAAPQGQQNDPLGIR